MNSRRVVIFLTWELVIGAFHFSRGWFCSENSISLKFLVPSCNWQAGDFQEGIVLREHGHTTFCKQLEVGSEHTSYSGEKCVSTHSHSLWSRLIQWKTRHVLRNLNKSFVEFSYVLEECEHRPRSNAFLCFRSGLDTDGLSGLWVLLPWMQWDQVAGTLHCKWKALSLLSIAVVLGTCMADLVQHSSSSSKFDSI